MLTLYYTPGACSMAAHIVLEESGEDYQAKKVDLAGGEQRTEDYLKINPLGIGTVQAEEQRRPHGVENELDRHRRRAATRRQRIRSAAKQASRKRRSSRRELSIPVRTGGSAVATMASSSAHTIRPAGNNAPVIAARKQTATKPASAVSEYFSNQMPPLHLRQTAYPVTTTIAEQVPLPWRR